MLVYCNKRPVLFASYILKAKKSRNTVQYEFFLCNIDCKLKWLPISPTCEHGAVKAKRVFAALQSKSFQIVHLTREATRLLLLRLANCFLISNYQNIMRTKIPCVQWPPTLQYVEFDMSTTGPYTTSSYHSINDNCIDNSSTTSVRQSS